MRSLSFVKSHIPWAISVVAIPWFAGCTELRRAAAITDDGGATLPTETVEAGVPDGGTDDSPLAALIPPDDTLPKVTYRAVTAVSASQVFIVGDETIVEFNGTKWSVVPVGGTELYGVWADENDAWAVGMVKNTNTGVFMHREGGRWIQFANVPHGLRAIYGSGSFRMATGNDGAVYFGTLPKPFANGAQHERAPDVPETVASPILASVAGNSPTNVIVTGDVGVNYRYKPDGTWATLVDATDRTRAYRAAFALPGEALDVILGGNYYGLWRYRGQTDTEGNRIPMDMLFEERESPFSAREYITSVWGPSMDHFVAVGTSGRFMVSQAGKPITVLPTRAGSRDLYGVSGTSLRDVWVVGADGVILHGSADAP